MNILRLIRYRFFLFAGMPPYVLGQVVAFGVQGSLNWRYSAWGFAGIFLVLVAVELFNECFGAKEGGDRIFSPGEITISTHFFPLGLSALAMAFGVGVYLTLQIGWLILLFSLVGFLGAYFYVGPPIRWAYRGFGELTTALCYGPFMVLGSYCIQTKTVAFVPLFVSIISGVSIFCLAILNEIPDYYQDVIVGKRNLVVRLGKKKAIVLLKVGLVMLFAILALAALVTLPWILRRMGTVEKNCDNPNVFLFAVNTIVVTHVVFVLSLGTSFLTN